MAVAQLSMQWVGLPGGTGYNFFYLRGTTATVLPLQQFSAALQPYVNTTHSLVVPNTGRVIDEVNGKMINVWGNGTQTTNPGTSTGQYAPASGAQTRWDTNGFVNGRHVRGRNFWVPLVVTAYDNTGLITATVANAINAAATNMLNAYAGSMVVWSRPTFIKDADGNPTETVDRPGSLHTISSATTPRKTAVLRGRRDT